MTRPGYRHRILILDRSGSIRAILKGQQSGFEEFLSAEATVPGKATYSLWDFDTEVRCLAQFASLDELRGYKIEPRGMTALYDAVGDAFESEGAFLAALPETERPEDVTAVVSSDGEENQSVKDPSGQRVRRILQLQQETYKWRVLFLGFGQAAFDEGARIGTRGGLTVNSVSSDAGSRNAWKMSSDYMARVPVAAAATMDSYVLSDEERALGESGEDPDEEG